MARYDVDAALELVADDLVYANVSLPTLYGKDRLEQVARPVLRPGRMGFNVHLNHVAAEGDVVLTDRVDELSFGRFATRFWVYGRFVVRDGQIAVWRDSFDWLDVTIANLARPRRHGVAAAEPKDAAGLSRGNAEAVRRRRPGSRRRPSRRRRPPTGYSGYCR